MLEADAQAFWRVTNVMTVIIGYFQKEPKDEKVTQDHIKIAERGLLNYETAY
jgi:hypothetical protein